MILDVGDKLVNTVDTVLMKYEKKFMQKAVSTIGKDMPRMLLVTSLRMKLEDGNFLEERIQVLLSQEKLAEVVGIALSIIRLQGNLL